MNKYLIIVLLICASFLPTGAHAFTFFTAYDALVTRIAKTSYQFRVTVDYNFDMRNEDTGIPALGTFCGFSLGQLCGEGQRNFAPISDKPGERVWYSDSWWRSDHLGYYPSSLPGRVFGYDFDYTGDVKGLSAVSFAAQATWAWSDPSGGGMKYESEIFAGELPIIVSDPANPVAVPEAPTVLLFVLGLVGFAVRGVVGTHRNTSISF